MKIHGIRKPDESIESIRSPVLPPPHRSDDLREQSEVLSFHEQPVLFEEREYPFLKVRQPCDRVGHHSAVWSFVIELSAIEVITNPLQQFKLFLVLIHLEDWRELPTSSASGVSSISMDAY